MTAPRIPDRPAPLVAGPVTQTDIVRYQGASGDMQPIHHDVEVARAAGLPGPFSVGMYQAGLLGSFVAQWFGAENVRRYRMRFKERVWPGDVLTCTGDVVDRRHDGQGWEVDVDLRCTRQDGQVAIEARATCVVPARPASLPGSA
jgi:acyl dehydratase